MIYIGTVLKGIELKESAIDAVLKIAMTAAEAAAGGHCIGQTPAINVVFHVPGSQGRPNWEGLRDARFSKKQKLLMVQVAVPEEMNDSSKAIDFVVVSLRGANAIAFEYYRQKGLEYPLREAEKMVTEIRERIMEKKDDIMRYVGRNRSVQN